MQLARTALRRRASVFEGGRETTRDVLRIGIQIRAGDWAFDASQEQELKLKPYLPFFDCAKQIEGFAKPHPDAQVLWYLISDSARLRKKALGRFKDRVVTSTAPRKHVACNVGDCQAEGRNQTQALLDAVGDLLSLAQTDYQVLTQKSGFGKVAAALAIDNWHSVYWPGGLRWGGRESVDAGLACECVAHRSSLIKSTKRHRQAHRQGLPPPRRPAPQDRLHRRELHPGRLRPAGGLERRVRACVCFVLCAA